MTTPKYLSTTILETEATPIEVFEHVHTNYLFAPKDSNKYALVVPYLMLTDGKEIIIYEEIDKEVEVGLKCLVEKSGEEEVGFADIMCQAFMDNIKSTFSQILTKSKKGDNGPDKPVGKDEDFEVDPAGLFPTNRAMFTTDRRYVFCPYFFIFPNTSLVKLFNTNKNIKYRSVYLSNLVKTGSERLKLTSMAKNVLLLIGCGDIQTPYISENPEDLRP